MGFWLQGRVNTNKTWRVGPREVSFPKLWFTSFVGAWPLYFCRTVDDFAIKCDTHSVSKADGLNNEHMSYGLVLSSNFNLCKFAQRGNKDLCHH